MRSIFFILYCLLISQVVFAQHYWDIPGTNQVTAIDSEKIVHAHYLEESSEVKLRPFVTYYWVKSGKIFKTDGGYSGKLLDGDFEEFYLNKNLNHKGAFKKGTKYGTWQEWFEDGAKKSTTTWKKGKLYGPFELFDSDHHILEKGFYKNNLLDGKLERLNQKQKMEILYYRLGKQVQLDSTSWISKTAKKIKRVWKKA